MEKKIILVDVDGVVADIHTAWLRSYNRDYNDTLQVSDIKAWAMHEFVKPECGKNIYRYLNFPDFYDDVLPIEGALEGVQILRDFGYRIVFVSAGFHEAKARWLCKQGFCVEFPYPDRSWSTPTDLILANDKSLIRGDYLIDDRPDNLFGHSARGILFDQPWNQAPFYPRVNGWHGVTFYFRAIILQGVW